MIMAEDVALWQSACLACSMALVYGMVERVRCEQSHVVLKEASSRRQTRLS